MLTAEHLQRIVDAASAKKAEDIVVLDLRELSSTLDYFVICTASPGPQIRAVQQSVKEALKDLGSPPPSVEGPSQRWVLLHFGGVVVHVMTKEARAHYDLESLWGDALLLPITPQLPEPGSRRLEPNPAAGN
jgi:ribosome-associated protein